MKYKEMIQALLLFTAPAVFIWDSLRRPIGQPIGYKRDQIRALHTVR